MVAKKEFFDVECTECGSIYKIKLKTKEFIPQFCACCGEELVDVIEDDDVDEIDFEEIEEGEEY